MAKLPARYNAVAFPFVLSGIMTSIVSGVSTLKVLGPVAGFGSAWLGAWALSWPVAFGAVLITLPLTRRIVGLFVDSPVAAAAPPAASGETASRQTASEAH